MALKAARLFRHEVTVMRGTYVQGSMHALKEAIYRDGESIVAHLLMSKYVNQPDIPENPEPRELEEAEEMRKVGEQLSQHFSQVTYEPIKS